MLAGYEWFLCESVQQSVREIIYLGIVEKERDVQETRLAHPEKLMQFSKK